MIIQSYQAEFDARMRVGWTRLRVAIDVYTRGWGTLEFPEPLTMESLYAMHLNEFTPAQRIAVLQKLLASACAERLLSAGGNVAT